jgi:hypothetical protein
MEAIMPIPRACCGEVLTARWTFKLELHGHQIFVAEKFIFNGLLAVGASQKFTARLAR